MAKSNAVSASIQGTKLNKSRNEETHLSSRVASIIAAKKRRKSGYRRKCQGMCFTVPTPDDPFNDGNRRKNSKAKNEKKATALNQSTKTFNMAASHEGQHQEANGPPQFQKHSFNSFSWFFRACMDSLAQALYGDGACDKGNPLFDNPWGHDFLKCFSNRQEMLHGTGLSSSIEQVTWVVSVAAADMASREEHGSSLKGPFLLFLVPSQEEALKVRSVCKHLKAFGIHTVSLHPGTSLEHQIDGLKHCNPEFVVSTTGRLLQLISFGAIDIAAVSFLVIDGIKSDHEDVVSIKKYLSGNVYSLVL